MSSDLCKVCDYYFPVLRNEDVYIPHEMIGYQLKQGLPLIAAWRKHMKVTQQELADKAGMSQPEDIPPSVLWS